MIKLGNELSNKSGKCFVKYFCLKTSKYGQAQDSRDLFLCFLYSPTWCSRYVSVWSAQSALCTTWILSSSLCQKLTRSLKIKVGRYVDILHIWLCCHACCHNSQWSFWFLNFQFKKSWTNILYVILTGVGEYKGPDHLLRIDL